ncbi:MAG: DinB family protein [Actinomycetota bacterium]|jgi:hypothetical protein
MNAELDTLNEFLDQYRAVLVAKATGLTDEQARSHAVEPSNLSILGLLRHMAEVERHWFRRILLNESELPDFFAADGVLIGTADSDFEFSDVATLSEGIEILQRAIGESHMAIEGKVPDDVSLATRTQAGQQVSLRWILIHMIEEYARHCGHADFLRERLDGKKGDLL